MLRVNLMIGDRELSAADGRTFDRRDPLTGEIATQAAAATIADAVAAADAAARAFPAWAATGPGERRALLNAAADLIAGRAEDFAEAMIAEVGATPAWCEFNVRMAAQMLREAAAVTTQIIGEVIPSDEPGRVAMAIRQPAGVVLGIAPWNAPVILGVRAIAMPLACGNTVILKASELSPGDPSADRHGVARRRLSAWRGQCGDQCAGRCRQGGRDADLAPGRAADQLHRLDAHRAPGRRNRSALSQADPARTRRQGVAGHSRRRRSRRGGRGRRLRRLRQSGPGLHVDRTHRGRREGRRRVRGEICRQGALARRRRSARRRRGARLAGQRRGGGARARPDRRRGRQGRAAACRRRRSAAPSWRRPCSIA